MRIDVIENSGPDNLRDVLKAELRRATDVAIAVAFVTQSGLDEILQPLRQVAATGRVRFVTGLYQQVTEPQALRTLLRVQEQTRGAFSVRLSTEPQFHRKLYLLRKPRQSIAIIGSSNLTREGLRSGGELNAILSLPKGSTRGKRITGAFSDDWEHRSVSLVTEQIDKYEKARPETRAWESFPKRQLADILGTAPSHRQAQDETDRSHWRDCITGFVKRKTEQVISETTNWDEKDYTWFAPGPTRIRSMTASSYWTSLIAGRCLSKSRTLHARRDQPLMGDILSRSRLSSAFPVGTRKDSGVN